MAGAALGSGENALFVRVKIELCYDGTDFSGWAAQPGRRTVEGVLAETLGHVLRLSAFGRAEPPRLTVAGRTDAGVHARGQAVHADIPGAAWAASADIASRRLARALPPDIRVRSIGLAPDGFDARFSALWRRYSYRVCDDPATADPLRRHDTLWHFRALDLDAMDTAAAGLVGEHDFAAFCRRREGATTVRGLRRLDWARDADGVAVACVIADAFCHNMVRSLVGALLAVGDGGRPPSWPASVLATAVRDPAVRVVPPHGLCLEEVRYPAPGELAERAVKTRRLRSLEAGLCGGRHRSGSSTAKHCHHADSGRHEKDEPEESKQPHPKKPLQTATPPRDLTGRRAQLWVTQILRTVTYGEYLSDAMHGKAYPGAALLEQGSRVRCLPSRLKLNDLTIGPADKVPSRSSAAATHDASRSSVGETVHQLPDPENSARIALGAPTHQHADQSVKGSAFGPEEFGALFSGYAIRGTTVIHS